MAAFFLTPHLELRRASRLGSIGTADISPGVRDYALIVGTGLLATAAVAVIDLSLKLPGHAILRSVLPVTLGMALVPRRGSASAIAGVGVLGTLGIAAFQQHLSLGALTSLAALGPLLDITLRRVKSSKRIVLACGVAGLLANLIAFGVKFGSKAIGIDGGGSLMRWLPAASLTYPVCGFLAGLVCGALWFYGGNHSPEPATDVEAQPEG